MERSPFTILGSLFVSWTGTLGTVFFENINSIMTVLCGLASLIASLYAIALSRERLRQLEKKGDPHRSRSNLDHLAIVFLALLPVALLIGCTGLPNRIEGTLYRVRTNQVEAVAVVPVVSLQTNRVPQVSAVTNQVDGVPVVSLSTALVEQVQAVTNLHYFTNLVAQPELEARPEAEAALRATGGVIGNLWGFGALAGALLGGAYHGYLQIRNRKINAALVQGIETAREILKTTPQGHQADQLFRQWLIDHQREAGILGVVTRLVKTATDTEAAHDVARFIDDSVQRNP